MINCQIGNIAVSENRRRYGMDKATLKKQVDSLGRGAQAALARHLGILPSTMNKLIKGSRKITADEADKIREFMRQRGTAGQSPSKSAAGRAAESPGDRLRIIRATMLPDLPRKIGVYSPAGWEALLDSPSLLHPHLAEEVAEATGLPMSYVQDGIIDDLTRDQLAVLFAGAAPRRDPPTPAAAAQRNQGPGAPRDHPSAGRKRSS